MIHKKQFTDIAKKIIRSQKGLRNHQLMHPSREWAIGLCVAALMFLGSAVWSSMMYLEYKTENLSQDNNTQEQPVVYREALVDSALDLYAEKNSKLNALLHNFSSAPPEVIIESDDEMEALSTDPVSEVSTTTPSAASNQVSSSTEEVVIDKAEEVPEEDFLPTESSVQPATSL